MISCFTWLHSQSVKSGGAGAAVCLRWIARELSLSPISLQFATFGSVLRRFTPPSVFRARRRLSGPPETALGVSSPAVSSHEARRLVYLGPRFLDVSAWFAAISQLSPAAVLN